MASPSVATGARRPSPDAYPSSADRGLAAGMPVVAQNSALRGGFSKRNEQSAPQPPPSPLRAIRAKCLDCSAGSRAEVRQCAATSCALWPFGHPALGAAE
jgi:hypothetical protein